ncbi:MAG: response regulator transcription factor [Chthoniobacterales bacterium]|nr:response regulator transcription factor [Chthoniobacterales bacterium]
MKRPTAKSTTSQRIKLIIVDRQRLVRCLLRRALSSEGLYDVIADSPTAQRAIAICEKVQPDLVILDMELPDYSAIRAVAEITRVSPGSRVLLCAGAPSEERLLDFIRSRADGFVDKTSSLDSLFEAVRRVTGGERFFSTPASPTSASLLKRPERAIGDKWSLTRREAEVLKLVAEGASNKKIAAVIGIKAGTVEVHRRNLMKKLGVRNAAGLTAYAFESGVVALRPGRLDGEPHHGPEEPTESDDAS